MLLAVNLNFVAFSHFLGDAAGQIFVFFILTVAAAESAIGLAILVVLVPGALIGAFSLPVAVLAHELSELVVILNGTRMARK